MWWPASRPIASECDGSFLSGMGFFSRACARLVSFYQHEGQIKAHLSVVGHKCAQEQRCGWGVCGVWGGGW